MPVHAPFGPAVADLVLATAVHAGDAMPPRAFVDQPLPGRDRKDRFRRMQNEPEGEKYEV